MRAAVVRASAISTRKNSGRTYVSFFGAKVRAAMILAIADACEHSTDNDGYNDARDCGFANSPSPADCGRVDISECQPVTGLCEDMPRAAGQRRSSPYGDDGLEPAIRLMIDD